MAFYLLHLVQCLEFVPNFVEQMTMMVMVMVMMEVPSRHNIKENLLSFILCSSIPNPSNSSCVSPLSRSSLMLLF